MFKIICKKNNIQIANWLITLSDNLSLEIENNKIIKYQIVDTIKRSLELIENDKLGEAISYLKIPKNMGEELEKYCNICQEEEDNIIKLPCNHNFCLSSLLKFYNTNKSMKNKCCYCTKSFKWSEVICS